MKTPSTDDASLRTTLAGAAAPAYLIDDRQTIAFANRALADWVGVGVEEIVGRRVEYHSEPGAKESGVLLTGLCPSPTAMAGERGAGSVSTVDPRGRLRRRRAEFLPLRQSGEAGPEAACPVLVLCDAADLAAGELATPAEDRSVSDQLHAAIARLRRQQADENWHAALLGEGAATSGLRRQVDALVASGANALITGAAGSGRSDLARLVFHRSNPTAGARLIPLHAGLLDTQQAIDRVANACDAAMGAAVTLLLEEAQELSADVQTLVAERLKQAPGVRVLATCDGGGDSLTGGLVALVATIRLTIPPLRDRQEDLPLLAQWFVERSNASGDRQVAGLTPAAIERLALYSWPGGVAELRAVIAAAHARTTTAQITPSDLPTIIQQAQLSSELPQRQPIPIALDTFLGRMERELVERALGISGGNKAEAARLLGMTRPRLYRRLTRLDLLGEESGDADGGPEEGEA